MPFQGRNWTSRPPVNHRLPRLAGIAACFWNTVGPKIENLIEKMAKAAYFPNF
jgi:hypothetical protein